MLLIVLQTIFSRFFESSKSKGAKLPTLGLNHNLIHSNPVVLQCFLGENLLVIVFLKFASVYKHSKMKWSIIMANHQVKINEKKAICIGSKIER